MITFSVQDLNAVGRTTWGRNTISYGFIGAGLLPNYMDLAGLQTNFSPNAASLGVSAAQQDAMRRAVDAIAAVANITFIESASIDQVDIAVGTTPFSTPPRSIRSRAATFQLNSNDAPDPNNPPNAEGDIWVSTRPGTQDQHMLGNHELGHALGLLGDTDLAGALANPDLNSTRYTMMSDVPIMGANNTVLAVNGFEAGPHAPMLLDILALQYLSGANELAMTGDDHYRFRIVDGWPIQAIWDAAGNDTLNGDDQNDPLYIDLRPGGESFLRAGSNLNQTTPRRRDGEAEVHLAFTPVLEDGLPDPNWEEFALNYIENAIGGSASDIISGNRVANQLEGRGDDDKLVGLEGNDILVGGLGNDLLFGDAGQDVYLYNAGDGDDVITDSDGNGRIAINGLGNILSADTALLTSTHPDSNAYGDVWEGVVGGQQVFFMLTSGSLATTGTLRIVGPALGNGEILVNNFVNGNLGITLDPTNRPELLLTPPGMGEGGAGTLVAQLAARARPGERMRITITGSLGSSAFAVLGADSIPFDNNEVEFEISEGQREVVLSLVSQGDVDTSATITVTATLLDVQGNVLGDQISGEFAFEAVVEPDEPETEIEHIGTAADDVLAGGHTDDFIDGLGGDDSIHGDGSFDGETGDASQLKRLSALRLLLKPLRVRHGVRRIIARRSMVRFRSVRPPFG